MSRPNVTTLSAERVRALLEAQDERDELRALVDLQHRRERDAIAAWRREKPGRERTLPDYGNFLLWLLDERDRLQAEVAALACLLDDFRHIGGAVLSDRLGVTLWNGRHGGTLAWLRATIEAADELCRRLVPE